MLCPGRFAPGLTHLINAAPTIAAIYCSKALSSYDVVSHSRTILGRETCTAAESGLQNLACEIL